MYFLTNLNKSLLFVLAAKKKKAAIIVPLLNFPINSDFYLKQIKTNIMLFDSSKMKMLIGFVEICAIML